MTAQMRILQAIGSVRERDLLDTEKALGLLDERPAVLLRRKKFVRTVLIAAVLSALFVGTAFAAGLFRLRDKTVPSRSAAEIQAAPMPTEAADDTPQTQPDGGYLSFYGYNDSPEALANRAWFDYLFAYSAQKGNECVEQGLGYYDWMPGDEWYKASPELESAYDVYTPFNREMADKLFEIRDEYGLKLYTREIFPEDQEAFHSITGTEPFFFPGEEYSTFHGNYVFEDGSFLCEGFWNPDGRSVADGGMLLYTLTRTGPGYVYPFARYIDEPEAYTEWEYTTAKGANVHIAWREGKPGSAEDGYSGDQVFIFYEENQWVITVGCLAHGGMSTERAQALADCFDFSAACRGEVNIPPA